MWHLHKLVLQSRNLSCREGAADLSQQSNSTSSHQSSTSSSLSTGSSSRSREVPALGRSRASSSALRPSQIWPFVMASMRRWSSASRYQLWEILDSFIYFISPFSVPWDELIWAQKNINIIMVKREYCHLYVIERIIPTPLYSKQNPIIIGSKGSYPLPNPYIPNRILYL